MDFLQSVSNIMDILNAGHSLIIFMKINCMDSFFNPSCEIL